MIASALQYLNMEFAKLPKIALCQRYPTPLHSSLKVYLIKRFKTGINLCNNALNYFTPGDDMCPNTYHKFRKIMAFSDYLISQGCRNWLRIRIAGSCIANSIYEPFNDFHSESTTLGANI